MVFNNQIALMKIGPRALIKQPSPVETIVTPVADIYETLENFIVKLDMPGADKETIRVSVEPGQLTARASIMVQPSGNLNLLFSEIGRKSYVREFNLGEGVEYANVQAEFVDGVLTITIPKSDFFKTRIIQIQ